ncbi:hypothetical protein HNP84_009460 [Thermocatellispora tengchongensis]|uniref:Sensor domain-containing protein n=1 Tax=Thermocatellispora tengchongensis TaxID=1073253 RepID=A0A840PLA2_9ACTN|nr:hypothetical protein [Thermocatellispora tengchongensis]MBB5139696.1 hypothetical protein [Thermocatellispora tengchongensis]
MRRIITTILATACAATAAVALAAQPASAATGHRIPEGFLLYEKAAAKDDHSEETSWRVSDRRGHTLAVNPCQDKSLARHGRAAARTIVYRAPEFQRVEQVLLYRGVHEARDAFGEVRAALRRCEVNREEYGAYRYSWQRAPLGDEALRVAGQSYSGRKGDEVAVGGERAYVVRRGNAIMIYSEAAEYGMPKPAQYSQQRRDAAKMVAKICAIARCHGA